MVIRFNSKPAIAPCAAQFRSRSGNGMDKPQQPAEPQYEEEREPQLRRDTDLRASNWHELSEYLFEESWQESLGRFRSSFAFRGMSDASFNLKTSLMRMGGHYERQEGHLLRNFRKY